MTDAIVTCSEHFTDLALNELRRQHRHLKHIQSISPQHLYVRNSGTFGKLTRPWKHKPPIYLHHLCPVHQTVALNGTSDDLIQLRQQANNLCEDDFIPQIRILDEYRYAAQSIIHSIAPTKITNNLLEYRGRVLSILIHAQTAYMGVSWAAQNLSPFAGGQSYFSEPVPNRAGLKLLEALNTFEIRLNPGTKALDLGAAPGAWTEVLRRRNVHVTAVAPTAMYDWLQVDPCVQTHEMTAELYLEQCNTQYDVLLNDMKLDAQYSAELMVKYATHLRRGGIAIMTLKLRMRDPRRVMDHSFRILRKAYKIVRVRQLVSNRKEVTVFLRRLD